MKIIAAIETLPVIAKIPSACPPGRGGFRCGAVLSQGPGGRAPGEHRSGVYQEFIRGYGLFAVGRVAEMDEVKDGMTWLKTEVPGYWDQRLTTIVPLLDYLGQVDTDHWERNAAATRRTVENDHV